MKRNQSFYIACIFLVVITYQLYQYVKHPYDLKCIVSDVNGKKYCVRNRQRLTESVDLMARVTVKMEEMVKYMKSHHPNDERTKRLVAGFDPNVISETLPTSTLTAYSENKGEKIAMCLNKNKKKGEDELIDLNTLTFVALHEMSHIMTVSIGHKEEFWQNFKFLLENAQKANIYTPTDYKKNSQVYCGMTLNNNPYFDGSK